MYGIRAKNNVSKCDLLGFMHHKSSDNINLFECNDQINSGVNCLHNIKCSLVSLTLSKLRSLDNEILQLYYTNKISHDTYMPISEIAYLCLYKPACISSYEPCSFSLKFHLLTNVWIVSLLFQSVYYGQIKYFHCHYQSW